MPAIVKTIFDLLLQAALPIALTAGFCFLGKRRGFKNLKFMTRQIIIGVCFGLAAVISTESGANIGLASANVRDAAPLCAGIIFGAPSGLIAGVIGAAERWLCVLWGGGVFTRLACSLATLCAGILGALMRKFMFSDKPPSWTYGLALGCVTEVIHMLFVFLTHFDDINSAFIVVRNCAVPMILLNGASVTAAVLLSSVIRREGKEKTAPPIARTFQEWLLLCVVGTCAASVLVSYFLSYTFARDEVKTLFNNSIADVRQSIIDESDTRILESAKLAASDIKEYLKYSSADDIPLSGNEFMALEAELCRLTEVSYIDENGVIIYSSNPEYEGFDMNGGEQSLAFRPVWRGDQKSFVQALTPISKDSSVLMKYAAVALPDGGCVQCGYDAEALKNEVSKFISDSVSNRRLKEKGFMLVFDDNFKLISITRGFTHDDYDIKPITQRDLKPGVFFEGRMAGENVYAMYDFSEGYYIMCVMTWEEAAYSQELSLYLTVFNEVIVFSALFVLVYALLNRRVVKNVSRVNASLAEITAGNLDTKVNVRKNIEFAELSDGINHTVTALKEYIDREAARMEKDLALAKSIQQSALPNVFPPYPEHNEFEIFARMDTAKEVGGDFYDFYFVGEDRLAFLIADVSGKGIPAAMFMMRAKAIIKNLAETGMDADEVFTNANKRLCEGNDAEMFVTAWLGIINLKTGLVTFANAGHNPPLVRSGSGTFGYFRSRPGFVLAGMDTVKYKKGELKLSSGDEIYLYTDGITEATNASEELYGEERLLGLLNSLERDAPADVLCERVKADVDAFVGDAPQFDDMTMLSLKLKNTGEKKANMMTELSIAATIDNIPAVTAFVDAELEKHACPMKAQAQIDVAIDELFGNIARYAYNPETGTATVRIEVTPDPLAVVITFIDNGIPYDPLAKADPDVTLPAEEREEGGLGIFLVKKTMDDISYEYKEGRNILTIKKNLK